MGNKSLRLLGLLPNKIGKIKVRQLVAGRLWGILVLYLVRTKSSVLYRAKGRDVGERRETGTLYPDVKGKAGLSIGYGWLQSLCGCSAVVQC